MTATASPTGPAPSAELAPVATEVTLRRGGLLRAELRRLRLRRLLVLTVLAYLALLLVGLGAEFFAHTKDNTAARAQAQENYDRSLADCRGNPGQYGPTDASGNPVPCEQVIGTVENFYLDRTYQVAQALPDSVTAAAGTFAVVAFLLGASAIGAEWSARTLPALLVWEPRRVRVLLTKVAALLLVVAAVAVLVQMLVLGAGVLTGHLRGSFAPLSPPVSYPGDVGGQSLEPGAPWAHRGSFWAALALQHARALGYFAVVEIGLQAFRPNWGPWLLTSNGLGWIQRDGYRVQLLRPEVNPDLGGVSEASFYTVHITNAEAGLYLLVLAALALGVATALFRRRDLT